MLLELLENHSVRNVPDKADPRIPCGFLDVSQTLNNWSKQNRRIHQKFRNIVRPQPLTRASPQRLYVREPSDRPPGTANRSGSGRSGVGRGLARPERPQGMPVRRPRKLQMCVSCAPDAIALHSAVAPERVRAKRRPHALCKRCAKAIFWTRRRWAFAGDLCYSQK